MKVGGGVAVNRVCIVCNIECSIYTCPKCIQPYCSLHCYRNHGSNCVASFHNTSLMEMMKNEKVSMVQQQSMHNVLQRISHQQRNNNNDDNNNNDGDDEMLVEVLEKVFKMIYIYIKHT